MSFSEKLEAFLGTNYEGVFTILSASLFACMSLSCCFCSWCFQSVTRVNYHRRRMELKELEEETEMVESRDFQAFALIELAKYKKAREAAWNERAFRSNNQDASAISNANAMARSINPNLPRLNEEAEGRFLPSYSKLEEVCVGFSLKFSVLMEVSSCVFVGFAIFILAAFGRVEFWLGIGIICALFFFKFVWIVTWMSPNYYYDRKKAMTSADLLTFCEKVSRKVVRKTKEFLKGFFFSCCCAFLCGVILLFSPWVWVYLFREPCLCGFFDDFGIALGPIGIESTLTTKTLRNWNTDQTCLDDQPPCAVYATLPEDTATSVFINFHTGLNAGSPSVFYDEETHFESKKELRNVLNDLQGDSPAGMDSSGRRKVFSALLTGLNPDTRYVIQIHLGESKTQTVYKTLPISSSQTLPLKVIFGGNIGTLDTAAEITKEIVNLNPDLIVLG